MCHRVQILGTVFYCTITKDSETPHVSASQTLVFLLEPLDSVGKVQQRPSLGHSSSQKDKSLLQASGFTGNLPKS